MAELVTGTVTGQIDMSSVLKAEADIRREAVVEGSHTRETVKDAGWENLNKTAQVGDRITDQSTAYFIASQQIGFSNATALASLTAATNANFNATLASIQLSEARAAAATALAAAATQALVTADGSNTRALMNANIIDELRFKNLKHENRHCGCEREEGRLHYGPAVSADYPA